MGFFHQFRLLLWKNFTLKKRTPFVLLFEVFIPLVLFVILILIRKKQPAVPMPQGNYYAEPLPSSGVVPIMQMFCDGGQSKDKNGFREFHHANTTQFLNQLQSVAKNHHFFNPGYTPSEMDDLPYIYKSIIDDPATLHELFKHGHDFQLSSVVGNRLKFAKYLHSNLSLPMDDINTIMNATIHISELNKLLFGVDPETTHATILRRLRRDITRSLGDLQLPPLFHQNEFQQVPFQSFLNESELLEEALHSQSTESPEALFYKVIENDGLLADPLVQKFLVPYLGLIDSNQDLNTITPGETAEFLKMVLFSPTALHQLACNDEFLKVIVPATTSNETYITDAKNRVCNMSKVQLLDLSNLLKREISDQEVINALQLHAVNLTSLENKVKTFMKELQKFYQFQESLYEMSVFAETLPQDSCSRVNLTSPSNSVNVTAGNITTSSPLDDDDDDDDDDSDDDNEKKDKVDQQTKKPPKFAGFLHLWNRMQRTFCGRQPKEVPKKRMESDIKDLNLDDLGISRAQQDNLKILVHVLYSNPKVLYAPNNTAADKIIKKANESFALMDEISTYARKWLNISGELRTYLMENSTAYNLASIKEMHRQLKNNQGMFSMLRGVKGIQEFLNSSVPDIPFFLHELNNIDNAACGWLSTLAGINLNVFRGFRTEEDLVDYFLTKAYSENVTTVAGLIFENFKKGEGLPPHVTYKIRQNATFTPTTKYVRNRYWYPGPGPWQHPYYQFGFVWIQDIIERAIVDVQVGRDVVEPGSYVTQFPHSCYKYDEFVFMIEHVMPLCLTISWVYSVAMLVQSIVYEKEQRLKEVMRMMGLSNAVHWCAWFTMTFIQMTITMGLLTIMLKIGNVLAHSNPWVVFTTLEVFAIVTIAFSFLVSTFYSKAKVAAACAGIVYFLTYVPYMYVAIREDVAGDQISAVIKSLVSLFSTTAFGLSGKYFAFYEEEGVGVQWDNIHLSPVENDEYSLLTSILMMILDSFLYSLLAWYIENVFPGSYGLPRPWYFLFSKTYWCSGATKAQEMDCGNILDMCRRNHAYSSLLEDQACALDQRDAEYARKFEADPTHLPQGVHIENLTKIYKTGKKLAVKNLTLSFYEGQITSFLGHNGAGKTTTMSILTGLFPPTSGYALIYDNDIRTDMDLIRQSLGMCPQHNVLFDKLTVQEHLWFYARLKGMKMEDIKPEMETMLEDIGLSKKRHCRVDCLSGGMQRKLSVGIAFVGGSHTVILDEPTAGVDPYARRAIWDLLVKYKHGRTILLSTHHMDEADILGDRIAIISNGELKCCGSSLFLKNTFGEGYHLNLAKSETEEDIESLDFSETGDNNILNNRKSFVSKCQESKVTEFINKHVSTAFLKSETIRELHYILPFEEAKKGNFEKLFNALDTGLGQLHVSSYGVMDTNLEEVFLKVTEAAFQEEDAKNANKDNNTQEDSDNHSNGSDQSNPSTQASSTNERDHEVEMGNLAGLSRNDSDESLIGHIQEPGANGYLHLPQHDDGPERDGPSSCNGNGTYRLSKKWLRLNQLRAVLIKRFHYITRNYKGLFSQIILPALFVSVAMTVALSAPKVKDPPPIELSPSQYFNVTQPKGNYIPYTNENPRITNYSDSLDAGPLELMQTFHLASGVGATCVLKSTHDRTFGFHNPSNITGNQKQFELLYRYYETQCGKVFVSGIHIKSYVPRVQIINNEDNLDDNYTIPSPESPSEEIKYYPTCHCAKDKSGFVCPGSSTFSHPPDFQVVTRDKVQNVTGTNTEKFLLYTQDALYRLHRYGAFSFGLESNVVPEGFGKSAPTMFRKFAVRRVAKAWYNHKGYHAMPVFLNTINNAILRANLPKSKGHPAAYGITVINHPLNQTNNKLNKDYILQGSDVLISIFIIVAMSFVPASFVVFLVYERSIKAKHLQFVSGIDPVMYWLGNYVWDMCNYTIPAFCIIMILQVFHIPAYTSPQNMPAVVSLFLLYGWSITPVMYPASFLFKEPSTAYICLIVINLFTGITCIVCSFLLEIFSYDKDLNRIHLILKDVFLMFPNYCLGRGLMDIAFNEYKNEFFFKTGQYNQIKSPFTWELTSRNLVAMAIVGVSFFLLTLLLEFKFFIKSSYRRKPHSLSSLADEDIDVATERKRLLRGSGRYDLIRIENLTKVYKTRKLGRHLAVDRLCLGVPSGECFGLLGVNGAGKTTTFKMLTGDIQPTSGDAHLNRDSVRKDMLSLQQKIGYCPQFDALFDELTAREHIQLYARLRGIPPKEEKQVVEWALKKLGLTQYADKTSGTYSGGNKRKLSTAIALIGHPPVIFMDEPTTGMDPHSRRFLWDLILSLVRDGRSVILTSHSMEECEVLCSRMAIMVNGQFKCLGSAQHLKNRYGDGYTFSIRLKGPDFDHSSETVQRFVDRKFPGVVLKEHHYNLLQYELRGQSVSLAQLFNKLEEAQKDLDIEDYSVSQNTLDNVFINFVKKQVEIVEENSDLGTEEEEEVEDDCPMISLDGHDHGLGIDSDEDDPTFRINESGTHLSLLNMET
ncbi:ATP-binding cassette sub-family A member 2-like isoform X2 [Mizuhopecten yessoensis]|nr:ATP-binding cassette sub-family A member 2-like isoform X2 [Mizuhopecten yessoensis]